MTLCGILKKFVTIRNCFRDRCWNSLLRKVPVDVMAIIRAMTNYKGQFFVRFTNPDNGKEVYKVIPHKV